MTADNVAVFIDLETTGLDLETESILEFGAVLVELPTFRKVAGFSALSPTREALQFAEYGGTDEYVQKMHEKSGLIQDLKKAFGPDAKEEECLTHDEWDMELADSLKRWGVSRQTCIWGSSVHFDKKFLAKYLPRVNALFHYRVVDSSSTMERLRHTNPDLAKIIDVQKDKNKIGSHRVLDDISDSIRLEELLTRYLYDPADFIIGASKGNE